MNDKPLRYFGAAFFICYSSYRILLPCIHILSSVQPLKNGGIMEKIWVIVVIMTLFLQGCMNSGIDVDEKQPEPLPRSLTPDDRYGEIDLALP